MIKCANKISELLTTQPRGPPGSYLLGLDSGFPHFFTGEIQGYFQVFKGHFFRFQEPFFSFSRTRIAVEIAVAIFALSDRAPSSHFTAAHEDWCGRHSETCGRGRICKRLFELDLTV